MRTYVGVARGRGAGEGVVHVNCPLETFAGVGVSCGEHRLLEVREGTEDCRAEVCICERSLTRVGLLRPS